MPFRLIDSSTKGTAVEAMAIHGPWSSMCPGRAAHVETPSGPQSAGPRQGGRAKPAETAKVYGAVLADEKRLEKQVESSTTIIVIVIFIVIVIVCYCMLLILLSSITIIVRSFKKHYVYINKYIYMYIYMCVCVSQYYYQYYLIWLCNAFFPSLRLEDFMGNPATIGPGRGQTKETLTGFI